MAYELRLSTDLEDFTEGVLLTWLKNVGEPVEAGDELVEIEADKANFSYPVDTGGVLIGIAVEEGEVVTAGDLLGWVGEPGESPPEPDQAPRSEQGLEAAPSTDPAAERVEAADDSRVRASPLARRMARDLGLDLTTVSGTGPGGRIVKEDLESISSVASRPKSSDRRTTATPSIAREVELNRLQLTIARRMAEAKASVPHFYLRTEVDMSACVSARGELKRAASGQSPVPSFNDFVVKAAAMCLAAHPKMNGSYVDGAWQFKSRVNVGIAVAVDDGLVVPVIPDADSRTLSDIRVESSRLTKAAHAKELDSKDLEGGTFTVSNLGMYGVTGFDAVVNPPQAAILLVGAIRETSVVREGQVAVRSILELGLSCDHRIVYGADGARFLDDLRQRLENPVRLAL